MGNDRKSYSTNKDDYRLLEQVGNGASAVVYRAIYLPRNEVVSVKCLDLDGYSINLDNIRKEAQTMSLIDHPNITRAYCSFVVDRNLWVVMPFMAEGSCLHLMKIAYPDGFEESVIGSILKETLKALEYLHRHGHIHRDVKAGNILLDSNGVVKLGDFGVSACMFDNGDRQRSRNTFIGTPCWMAPEVLQPGCGYDFKADIWSFGITALELAHGHAPFSKFPPLKVLLMTIQNAPPGLDYDRDKRFSKSFKEMVAMCLVKDQRKRPTAEKLLKHSFFKHAKPPELSVKIVLTNLPPLWDRVKALQLKDAAQLVLKRMPSAEQEALSQNEYKRGVSAWNFDVEDLKAQAELVQDDDDIPGMKEDDESMRLFVDDKDASASRCLGKPISTNEIYCRGSTTNAELSQPQCLNTKREISESNLLGSDHPTKKVNEIEELRSESIKSVPQKDLLHSHSKSQTGKSRQTQSGPLMPAVVLNHSPSEWGCTSERCEVESQAANEKGKHDIRRAPSFSGPLMLPNRASANSLSAPIRSSGGFRDSLEEKKTNVVQIKGRFSVTSENLDLINGSPLRKSASVGDWKDDSKQLPVNPSSRELNNSTLPASLLMPHLQSLFQQTLFQQDLIMDLLNSFQQAEVVDAFQNAKVPPPPHNLDNDANVETAASKRERLLLAKISELKARMISLTDELTTAKLRHTQVISRIFAASAGHSLN
ncbi:PREDICTED: serine/threonine-protein kinase BLUS1-like isoform X2 [Nelumbo nucifera]|uniref:Serine/threonine-protein kinase BLUS1-like isoform X2 n=2 Tax=Nelumbo nucifera TaxID=4432 RepID=A0A1U8AW38_NELNU|nr:PREDICTED: serine/threonine-protein kinase BLUS1-like isoform X2 [Nelumbo nucifera]DAD18001.1 TPA_asm: hypothetical protein HUJ06_019464 [Nelumbo nucifera]